MKPILKIAIFCLLILSIAATVDSAHAQTDPPTIRINDFSINPNQSVQLSVEAFNLENLGSVTVSVTYDPEIFLAIECFIDPNKIFTFGICNTGSAPNQIAFNLLSVDGISGDVEMIQLTLVANTATEEVTTLDIEVQQTSNPNGEALIVDAIDGIVTIESGPNCIRVRQMSQDECQALVDMYKGAPAFFEENRASWQGTTAPCEWAGVECQAGHVTTLDLQPQESSETSLDILPDQVLSLTNLTTLNLSENNVVSLPSEILELTDLVEIDLSGNNLGILPTEIISLTNLTMLNLAQNNLAGLLTGIGNLTDLTDLDLSGNSLDIMPTEIISLTNLTVLNLAQNNLASLPAEIGTLTALATLDLSQNNLSSLPVEISNLSALTDLDLTDNQLSTLPSEISQLINLDTLDVTGTSLETDDVELAAFLTEVDADGWQDERLYLPVVMR